MIVCTKCKQEEHSYYVHLHRSELRVDIIFQFFDSTYFRFWTKN